VPSGSLAEIGTDAAKKGVGEAAAAATAAAAVVVHVGARAAEQAELGASASPSQGRGTTAAPAAPAPAVVHAVGPCEDPQDLAPGRAMAKFISIVKRKLDSISKRVGNGSQKKGVEGTLDRGSPWVYPDDPLLSPVPDVDTHWLTPVFVFIGELLDESIKAARQAHQGAPMPTLEVLKT